MNCSERCSHLIYDYTTNIIGELESIKYFYCDKYKTTVGENIPHKCKQCLAEDHNKEVLKSYRRQLFKK